MEEEDLFRSRFLTSARDVYDSLEFNTDSLFNEPAPEPWVAFLIGSLFSLGGFAMWCHRVWKLKTKMEEEKIPFRGSSMFRALISATIDASSSPYVIVSYSAASFLLLGAIQLNYEKTLIVMLILYFITSFAEVARILLTFRSTDSLENVRLSCDILRAQFRNLNPNELKASSMYEDLGRGMSTVLMTFFTQCLFISFVFVDIYNNSTSSCRDGTKGCPVGGTFGSWGFYVIGIYMACSFQLGPKTNYGSSEQNPAFWIQLLIVARGSPKVTWYDPIKHKHKERQLSLWDFKIWFRFFMTFLINGVGFHILVHALPIQVASQSSFTGVVGRAVGMMYLVDLDDTTGYTLTIMKEATEKLETADVPHVSESMDKSDASENKKDTDSSDLNELSAEAQRIIDEARAKLELLAKRRNHDCVKPSTSATKVLGLLNNTDSESEAEASRDGSKTSNNSPLYDVDEGNFVEVVKVPRMFEI